MPSLSKFSILCLAQCFVSATLSHGAVLMLDFGPTAVTSTTNSPYHTVNSSFTQTGWNTSLGTSDIPAGSLIYSDGSSASGVSVNLGRSADNGTSILLGSNPSSSNPLGGSLSSGVYAGSSVGKDAIFSGAGAFSGPTRATGLQIGGLSAGLYDIYILARNTSANPAQTYSQVISIGQSASAGDFNFSSFTSSSLTYTANNFTTAWVEGENYAKFTVNLAEGNFLNLAVNGTTSATQDQNRGFLNMVQIVAVPEPGIVPFMLAGAWIGLLFRRRRGCI